MKVSVIGLYVYIVQQKAALERAIFHRKIEQWEMVNNLLLLHVLVFNNMLQNTPCPK